MQLHYHQDPRGNFGDDLNRWIWDHLLPGWQDWDAEVTLFGVGTLLNAGRLEPLRDRRVLIVGSGAGYGPLPAAPLPAGWDIRAVRGPLSAQSLGVGPETAAIDPAALLPLLPEFRDPQRAGPPIFVPHVDSVHRHDWPRICAAAGVAFVSPSGEARQVIHRIASAPLVIAESMHAAIIADAFRVPWVPVRIGEKFRLDKWRDWALSLDMEVTPQPLFSIREDFSSTFPVRYLPRGKHWVRRRVERLQAVRKLRLAASSAPYLSKDIVLDASRKKLLGILDKIIHEYG